MVGTNHFYQHSILFLIFLPVFLIYKNRKRNTIPDLVYQFVLKDGDKECSRVEETKLKYIDSNFWSNIIPEMIDMCINENQDDNEELMNLKSFMEDNYEN